MHTSLFFYIFYQAAHTLMSRLRFTDLIQCISIGLTTKMTNSYKMVNNEDLWSNTAEKYKFCKTDYYFNKQMEAKKSAAHRPLFGFSLFIRFFSLIKKMAKQQKMKFPLFPNVWMIYSPPFNYLIKFKCQRIHVHPKWDAFGGEGAEPREDGEIFFSLLENNSSTFDVLRKQVANTKKWKWWKKQHILKNYATIWC